MTNREIQEPIFQIDWFRMILAAVALLAICACIWLYLHPRERVVAKTEFQKVPEIRTVHDVQRVTVPGPARIVYLDKHQVAEKLGMPSLETAAIAPPASDRPDRSDKSEKSEKSDTSDQPAPVPGNAADYQVTATAELPESDAGYEEVSILNTATGETSIVAREKEPDLFAFENHGALGAWYGYNLHLNTAVDLTAQWTFARIWKTHLGLRGDAGTDSGVRIQAGVLYQW